MDEIVSVYIQECREQLAEMESGLLRLEQTPDDRDNINAIFRAAHTIKGGAGVIECRFIEKFTHSVENLLDRLRNGELAVTPSLATLLLECCDHMNALVDVLATEETELSEALEQRGNALHARLASELNAGSSEAGAPQQSGLSLHEDKVEIESNSAVVNTDSWHISVRFGRNVLRGGTDPLSFIRYLGEIGEIIGIETIAEGVETDAQRDCLRALHCRYAQGYLFSRPVPLPEFERFLAHAGS